MTTLIFKVERAPSPCGELLIATDCDGALRALDWTDREARLRRLLQLHYGPNAVQLRPERSVSDVRSAIEAYLEGNLQAIDSVPVKTAGTSFQREVWTALRNIQAGTTLSYGALAAQLNRPAAMRAVGLANGSNPISVVIPCHRVIGADGSLTGYGGGLPRKRWLLEHEGLRIERLRRAA